MNEEELPKNVNLLCGCGYYIVTSETTKQEDGFQCPNCGAPIEAPDVE
jgi:predicted RNA-binding Zn-ribbon protein involved in translation (DUF1610 family)